MIVDMLFMTSISWLLRIVKRAKSSSLHGEFLPLISLISIWLFGLENYLRHDRFTRFFIHVLCFDESLER
jgi:hypothetical protein